jgi:hypothetical protein
MTALEIYKGCRNLGYSRAYSLVSALDAGAPVWAFRLGLWVYETYYKMKWRLFHRR